MSEPKVYRIERFTGGLNLKQDPTCIFGGVQLEQAIDLQNCDLRDGVSLQSRDGYTLLVSNTYAKNIVGLYPFYVGVTRHLLVLTWDGADYDLFDSTTSKKAGAASAIYFNPASYNDLCYIPHASNSDSENYNLKYNGTTITKCGIDAPADKCWGTVGASSVFLYGSTYAHGKLYKWNGVSVWSEVAPQLGSATYLYSLTEFNGKIYAGTNRGTLFEWDGSAAWVEVAPKAYDDTITMLCVFENNLYGMDSWNKLQKWNGSSAWIEVTPYTDWGSNSLCVYNSGAGEHIYNGGNTGNLLEWNGTDAWVFKATYAADTWISKLIIHNSGSGNHLYGVGYNYITNVGFLLEWDNNATWVLKGSVSAVIFYDAVVYNSGSGNHLYMAGSDGKLYEWNNVNTLTSVTTAGAGTLILALAVHSGYCYAAAGGSLFQWNKSNAWVEKAPMLGGEGVISLISFGPSQNLDGVYQYFYSYVNSVTGQESALSPISDDISAADQVISLSNIDPSSDSQVDKKNIYRTGGTLTTINFITEIANGTTVYEDNLADISVGDLEDCSKNDVLPAVRFFSMHHHQLFAGYSEADNGYVFDSRFYQPESFPDTFFFQVGNTSDPVVAIMPLDIDVIVYTKFHTFRLRYIGTSEGDVILEEISPTGLASDNTLVTGIDESGRPFHLFLGQSAKGRGIYRHDGSGISLISRIIDPIFTGERSDITPIAWTALNTCCATFAGNKYYLAYPEYGQTVPDKVLVIDFAFSPPVFLKHSFQSSAMVYDVVTDEFIFGGTGKQVYKFTGTSDYVPGTPPTTAAIALIYQTPYFGDRNQYEQVQQILFNANTQNDTLTVKIYADYSLKQTLTCATASMQRVKLMTDPTLCLGKMFSIRFEISSKSRVKISPPLEVETIEFKSLRS